MSKMTWDRLHFRSLDSTNLEAQRLIRLQSLRHKTLITSDFQEAGKGQYGREWQSTPRSNILSSWIIRPKEISIENQFLISMMSALAVASCVQELVGQHNTVIKWPNDILVGNKKTCGILISNILQGHYLDYTIIGIGLNVNQMNFDKMPHATSLQTLLGREVPIEEVLVALQRHIDDRYDQLLSSPSDIVLDYKKSMWGYEDWVMAVIGEESLPIFIMDVQNDGRLVVKQDESIFIYGLGECRIIYPTEAV